MVMKAVRDNDYGLYLWKLPNGKYLQNNEGEFLCLPSRYGDIKNMNQIGKDAKMYGYPEGRAEFIAGGRQVSHSEHDDQMERMLDGRLPDPFDVGALKDEIRQHGK